ncbi:hypothetical protein RGQ29_027031 [Quercus rubra]|uniref:Uncharacterized protein n=1 Tax=Quercus rubra TaxID=3512 RepID=A0AAN7IGY3_QUERU|nr:hypothetical protein RGQ29_027031 [Quercus rubra]
MSIPVFRAPSQIAKLEVIRRTVYFHPNIWGDRFINNISKDKDIHFRKVREVEESKEKVRRELLASVGVAYNFEREIEEALEHVYATYNDNNDVDDDLYNVSLHFRLLHQQGFKISCDEDGQFKESMTNNVEGMLAFYEATHLRVHGEDILDEALEFTTTHLKSIAYPTNNPLATQITRALKQPLHKGIPRDASHNKDLLNLSKLDFNLVQSLHKEVVGYITRWWKDLDFVTKLPFARDRVVECYFWTISVYFEPQYSLARKILKVIAITYLQSNFNCSIDQLPDYMQICYRALLDVFEAANEELAKQERSYRVSYAKDTIRTRMKLLVWAYFDKSKWFFQNYIPTMEDYMNLALRTSTYPMLTTVSFLGMGDIVTKKVFDWIFSTPKIITASSLIGWSMNDMRSHKFEQERGHVASAIECYLKQHGRVVDAWKDINGKCLRPTAFPIPLLMCVLNLT